jgi:ABC-type antimicrobial peptide transport system permease subunit
MPSIAATAVTSIKALRRNPLRSALTTLGIIIGIASVIAMVQIGEGSSAAIKQTIKNMGANTLIIFPGAAASGGVSFGGGSAVTLTSADAAAIARDCPSVSAAAPVVNARMQLVHGSQNWVPQFLVGSTPAYFTVRDWKLKSGRFFNNDDVRNANEVCVLGQTDVKALFPSGHPLGKIILVQQVPLRVIGVLRRKGANMMGMDQDDIVVLPWTTLKYRISGSALMNQNENAASTSTSTFSPSQLYPQTSQNLYPAVSSVQAADTPNPVSFPNVNNIQVSTPSAAALPQAMAEINALLRQRHHLLPNQPDDFNIRDLAEISHALGKTSTLMTDLLTGVALISLVVGGVGIMNIMLVSVTERTREIGLRMALGAKPFDILGQFIIEAIVLCLFGGALGILIGQLLSTLVQRLFHWPIQVSVPAVVASFLVSAFVGVAFGYYPAWKASRLDPIEALRYE